MGVKTPMCFASAIASAHTFSSSFIIFMKGNNSFVNTFDRFNLH